jgi:hypothetical protein
VRLHHYSQAKRGRENVIFLWDAVHPSERFIAAKIPISSWSFNRLGRASQPAQPIVDAASLMQLDALSC